MTPDVGGFSSLETFASRTISGLIANYAGKTSLGVDSESSERRVRAYPFCSICFPGKSRVQKLVPKPPGFPDRDVVVDKHRERSIVKRKKII